MGILVSLIPIIQSIATGNSKTQLQSGFYWPIILLVATVPGVLMNILEEDVFEDVVRREGGFGCASTTNTSNDTGGPPCTAQVQHYLPAGLGVAVPAAHGCLLLLG